MSARNTTHANKDFIHISHIYVSLSKFQDVDDDELFKAIQRLPNERYEVDLIPIWFLKEFSKMILTLVKSVVNLSFSDEIAPKSCKSAQITPLLGNPSLDHNVASSYRPISKQPLLSMFSKKFIHNKFMS